MLRSRGTLSKNKTQTISISALLKKVIIKFLLFNDLPSYLKFVVFEGNVWQCQCNGKTGWIPSTLKLHIPLCVLIEWMK